MIATGKTILVYKLLAKINVSQNTTAWCAVVSINVSLLFLKSSWILYFILHNIAILCAYHCYKFVKFETIELSKYATCKVTELRVAVSAAAQCLAIGYT